MKKAKTKTKTATKSISKTITTPQKRNKSYALADSAYIHSDSDPAHAPGHKKMNLRNQFEKTGQKNTSQNAQALNNMSASSKIKRTSSTNRRIITGAAIGKTGQIVIK